jgi:hypothetical protein
MTHYRLVLCVLLIALLTSCSTPTPDFIPTILPTQTPVPPISTPIPPKSTPVPTPTATSIPAPARVQYTMNIVLDYAAKSVAVDETIVYPNHSGQVLTDLVLAVEPNFWQNCFTLKGLDLDGTAVTNYTLDGQKLSFALPNVFQPNSIATIQIQYSLLLPEIVPSNPNISRPRIFGFTPNQINLTNWYPFVVPNIGGQWVLHDPWYYGEHLVYDAADYIVNVKPADPAVNPVIAASSAPSPNGEWTKYTLTSGRTFVISASTEYHTSSIQVGNTTVTSYYFQFYKGAGEAAMNASAQALQIYSQRYGPYPHQTLAIVMGDFNDGMEFSALYFHSRGIYNLYDGTLNNLVISVAVHETAHQWWFEQVANDQAEQPWLDEALATYSEHVYYETASPTSVKLWWWPIRIDIYQPQGWVDIPIYAGGGFRTYTNAVYFRGAHFLDDLRTRIGDASFFAFLQDYLAQENGRIANTTDFFRILSQHTTIDYSDLVRQYFQNVY